MAAKKSKKRRLNVPGHVVAYVWARAAGRCEFLGCNEPVWKDVLTTKQVNVGKLAHIVAAREDGPRGDRVESPKLEQAPSNIMLLCGPHHDLVDDKKHETTYPKEMLREYKRLHHERIEALTAIQQAKKSASLLVLMPVGAHTLSSTFAELAEAMAASGYYPDEEARAVVDLNGMSGRDHDAAFWDEARSRLQNEVESRMSTMRHNGGASNLSLFAFGPIPLLVFLGHELDEKANISVYNRHRQPPGWKWPDAAPHSGFSITDPVRADRRSEVALVLSVTSEVQIQPVFDYLGRTLPAFSVSWPHAVLDSMKSPDDLVEFSDKCREVMEHIHRVEATRVHLFPAVPVAAAVSFGRALQKKLHPPIMLHDFHQGTGGWRPAFELVANTRSPLTRQKVESQNV